MVADGLLPTALRAARVATTIAWAPVENRMVYNLRRRLPAVLGLFWSGALERPHCANNRPLGRDDGALRLLPLHAGGPAEQPRSVHHHCARGRERAECGVRTLPRLPRPLNRRPLLIVRWCRQRHA